MNCIFLKNFWTFLLIWLFISSGKKYCPHPHNLVKRGGMGMDNQPRLNACMLAPPHPRPKYQMMAGTCPGWSSTGGGNRNRNDNQLELNACMLAPTILICRHQLLSGRCPVWWKQTRNGPPRWLSWLYRVLANQLLCWKLRLWWGWVIVRLRLL